jgi:hypothetical protein
MGPKYCGGINRIYGWMLNRGGWDRSTAVESTSRSVPSASSSSICFAIKPLLPEAAVLVDGFGDTMGVMNPNRLRTRWKQPKLG